MATKNGGTLYVLQARPPAIIALSPDGSHEVVVANLTRTPDGIKVDAENQMVYWTNMGTGIHLVTIVGTALLFVAVVVAAVPARGRVTGSSADPSP